MTQYLLSIAYCMVRPYVQDDKLRAVSECSSSVHTDHPNDKLLIVLSTLHIHIVHLRVSDVEHLYI